MEFEQIIKLIKTISDSELTQFTYEESGLKMVLKKEKEQIAVSGLTPTGFPPIPPTGFISTNLPQDIQKEGEKTKQGNVVVSPLVGTFYASPSPEEEPFVKVGDTVKKGQVLGIVEAMKLMNEIESEFDGVVKEILVENGSVIEFGQPMFVIE